MLPSHVSDLLHIWRGSEQLLGTTGMAPFLCRWMCSKAVPQADKRSTPLTAWLGMEETTPPTARKAFFAALNAAFGTMPLLDL